MSLTKDALLQQYPFKIELHAHTSPASGCSDVEPEKVVQFYKALGYDCIVLTNHFLYEKDTQAAVTRQMTDYLCACEAGEQCGLKVLLGAEIRFAENSNDYLLFGVNEEILSLVFDHLDKDLAAFRQKLPLADSLLIQAHPFRSHCQIMDSSLLNGVEIFNMHPHHNSNNHLAQEFYAQNPNLIPTAGSDYHHDKPGHCGTTALRSAILPKDSFELVEILKSRDYLLQIYNDIYIP